MDCPICRSSDTEQLYDRVADLEHGSGLTASFARCKSCGVLFQNPLPDAQSLRAMYPANYRASSARGLYGRLKYFQALMIARRLRAQIGDPQARILELGCGAGQLLLALRQLGYSRLSGVDWTIAPELAKEAPSIAFIAHDITSYVPPQPVDVVVLNNVIEHVRDPTALLGRYRGYLGEHGSIVLLTPNAQSMSHRVFGRYWSGLHSPWHVHVFTHQSLAALAERSGLQIGKVVADEDPGGWAISAQNRWRSLRRGAAKPGGSGFSAVAALALACCAPLALLAKAVGGGSSLLAIMQVRAAAR